MIILGISPLDKDATVTLMIDGRIEWAIAEERLSRRKMHAGFPHRALQAVLELAGITPEQIDHVVYAFLDWETETRLMWKNYEDDYQFNRKKMRTPTSTLLAEARRKVRTREFEVPGLSDPNETMHKPWHKRMLHRLAARQGIFGNRLNRRQLTAWLEQATADHRNYHFELLTALQKLGLDHKLDRVGHHQTHVANAFYCSGFERALVATVDAYGSGLSATISVADQNRVNRIAQIETPYSLGVFYEAVTSALGYAPDRHAGKIVGLAAYGDAEILAPVLRNLFEWHGGQFRMRRSSDLYLARHLASHFPKIDVAAAYQRVLEEVVQHFVAHYVQQTGLDTVVLSGGVAANVKLNQRIHEIPGVQNIYVHPAMGDGGCGTGAAVLKSLQVGEAPGRLESVYLGPEFSERQLEEALRSAGLPYRRSDDVEHDIARLIAENKVVARFNGRMEYGPRALGNRSILYPAQDPTVNQWLNERLGRTEFMPFAPATLYEDRHACYQHVEGAEFTAQFMTVTFNCTPWMQQNCPAAVHVDGTARPQLVTEQSNPSFYRMLRYYKAITGIPSVINTSFNMHEEPIVCTPHDAVRAFFKGELDCLAIGPFLMHAPPARPSLRGAAASVPASAS